MTVVLFDGVIDAYMENPQGPVARDVERRAQAVVEVARAGVRKIMHRAPFDVAQNVNYVMEGNEAVIGIDVSQTLHGGRSPELYLDAKVAKEGGSWLGDALEAARD